MDYPFLTIPMAIIEDERLNNAQMILYGFLWSLVQKEGYCWATNKYLADKLKLTPSTVARHLGTLEECGHIRREVYRDENNRVITRKIYLETIFSSEKPAENDDETQEKDVQNDGEGVPADLQGGPRKSSKNLPADLQGGPRKNRKENNITEYLNEYINNKSMRPRVREALLQFCEMRMEMAKRDKRKPFTLSAFKLILKRLDELAQNDEEKIAILNNSVMNNWQGVFPLKGGEKQRQGSQGLRDGTYDAYINSAITNDTFGGGMS